MKSVALIPARKGSKRVKDKNIRKLCGHPLMAYSIQAAILSGKFDKVVVSTDSKKYADIAEKYGAEVAVRPKKYSGDKSPDFEWVNFTMDTMPQQYAVFSILRPTSPFRTQWTIRRAWDAFFAYPVDSLRAVEKCSQHPGKMWVMQGREIIPFLPLKNGETPWHSSQYQSLPEIYVQNASLEIAWKVAVLQTGTISGHRVMPFVTQGWEGFDINTEEDWLMAEYLAENDLAYLTEFEEGE